MAGTVSAADPIVTGVSPSPGCDQNQSGWVFGGTCRGGSAMITFGMAGAGFSGTPTSGPAPLRVQFNANSGPGTATWSWDFGDGSYGSGTNPVHTYTTPGSYTVKLTVRQGLANVDYPASAYFSAAGESTWQKENMIQVTGPISTGNLVSSGPEAAVSEAAGLIQAGTTGPVNLALLYQPGTYQPVTLRKAHPLNFQGIKISQGAPAPVLAVWRTASLGNRR